MIRILPYLMILLMVFVFSKFLSIVDTSEDFFNGLKLSSSTNTKKISDSYNQGDNAKNNMKKSKQVEVKRNNTDGIMPSCPQLEDDKSSQGNSPTLLRLVQELKQKRKSLNEREQDILIKENSLNALKQYIENRIDSLEKLQNEMQGTLGKYNSKQDERTARLVKIYESMKPKDAAKIFEQLQLGILIDVTEHMKETRLAPILAEMNPEKAKELTAALASKKNSYY